MSSHFRDSYQFFSGMSGIALTNLDIVGFSDVMRKMKLLDQVGPSAQGITETLFLLAKKAVVSAIQNQHGSLQHFFVPLWQKVRKNRKDVLRRVRVDDYELALHYVCSLSFEKQSCFQDGLGGPRTFPSLETFSLAGVNSLAWQWSCNYWNDINRETMCHSVELSARRAAFSEGLVHIRAIARDRDAGVLEWFRYPRWKAGNPNNVDHDSFDSDPRADPEERKNRLTTSHVIRKNSVAFLGPKTFPFVGLPFPKTDADLEFQEHVLEKEWRDFAVRCKPTKFCFGVPRPCGHVRMGDSNDDSPAKERLMSFACPLPLIVGDDFGARLISQLEYLKFLSVLNYFRFLRSKLNYLANVGSASVLATNFKIDSFSDRDGARSVLRAIDEIHLPNLIATIFRFPSSNDAYKRCPIKKIVDFDKVKFFLTLHGTSADGHHLDCERVPFEPSEDTSFRSYTGSLHGLYIHLTDSTFATYSEILKEWGWSCFSKFKATGTHERVQMKIKGSESLDHKRLEWTNLRFLQSQPPIKPIKHLRWTPFSEGGAPGPGAREKVEHPRDPEATLAGTAQGSNLVTTVVIAPRMKIESNQENRPSEEPPAKNKNKNTTIENATAIENSDQSFVGLVPCGVTSLFEFGLLPRAFVTDYSQISIFFDRPPGQFSRVRVGETLNSVRSVVETCNIARLAWLEENTNICWRSLYTKSLAACKNQEEVRLTQTRFKVLLCHCEGIFSSFGESGVFFESSFAQPVFNTVNNTSRSAILSRLVKATACNENAGPLRVTLNFSASPLPNPTNVCRITRLIPVSKSVYDRTYFMPKGLEQWLTDHCSLPGEEGGGSEGGCPKVGLHFQKWLTLFIQNSQRDDFAKNQLYHVLPEEVQKWKHMTSKVLITHGAKGRRSAYDDVFDSPMYGTIREKFWDPRRDVKRPGRLEKQKRCRILLDPYHFTKCPTAMYEIVQPLTNIFGSILMAIHAGFFGNGLESDLEQTSYDAAPEPGDLFRSGPDSFLFSPLQKNEDVVLPLRMPEETVRDAKSSKMPNIYFCRTSDFPNNKTSRLTAPGLNCLFNEMPVSHIRIPSTPGIARLGTLLETADRLFAKNLESGIFVFRRTSFDETRTFWDDPVDKISNGTDWWCECKTCSENMSALRKKSDGWYLFADDTTENTYHSCILGFLETTDSTLDRLPATDRGSSTSQLGDHFDTWATYSETLLEESYLNSVSDASHLVHKQRNDLDRLMETKSTFLNSISHRIFGAFKEYLAFTKINPMAAPPKKFSLAQSSFDFLRWVRNLEENNSVDPISSITTANFFKTISHLLTSAEITIQSMLMLHDDHNCCSNNNNNCNNCNNCNTYLPSDRRLQPIGPIKIPEGIYLKRTTANSHDRTNKDQDFIVLLPLLSRRTDSPSFGFWKEKNSKRENINLESPEFFFRNILTPKSKSSPKRPNFRKNIDTPKSYQWILKCCWKLANNTVRLGKVFKDFVVSISELAHETEVNTLGELEPILRSSAVQDHPCWRFMVKFIYWLRSLVFSSGNEKDGEGAVLPGSTTKETRKRENGHSDHSNPAISCSTWVEECTNRNSGRLVDRKTPGSPEEGNLQPKLPYFSVLIRAYFNLEEELLELVDLYARNHWKKTDPPARTYCSFVILETLSKLCFGMCIRNPRTLANITSSDLGRIPHFATGYFQWFRTPNAFKKSSSEGSSKIKKIKLNVEIFAQKDLQNQLDGFLHMLNEDLKIYFQESKLQEETERTENHYGGSNAHRKRKRTSSETSYSQEKKGRRQKKQKTEGPLDPYFESKYQMLNKMDIKSIIAHAHFRMADHLSHTLNSPATGSSKFSILGFTSSVNWTDCTLVGCPLKYNVNSVESMLLGIENLLQPFVY